MAVPTLDAIRRATGWSSVVDLTRKKAAPSRRTDWPSWAGGARPPIASFLGRLAMSWWIRGRNLGDARGDRGPDRDRRLLSRDVARVPPRAAFASCAGRRRRRLPHLVHPRGGPAPRALAGGASGARMGGAARPDPRPGRAGRVRAEPSAADPDHRPPGRAAGGRGHVAGRSMGRARPGAVSGVVHRATWVALSIATATVTSSIIYGRAARARGPPPRPVHAEGEARAKAAWAWSTAPSTPCCAARPRSSCCGRTRRGAQSLAPASSARCSSPRSSAIQTRPVFDYGRTRRHLYMRWSTRRRSTSEALVREFGPQDPGRVVHILRQVAGSLAEAHGFGSCTATSSPPTSSVPARGGVPDGQGRRLRAGQGTSSAPRAPALTASQRHHGHAHVPGSGSDHR
jgi:hypothetical protein